MARLSMPNRPATTVAELQRDVQRLVPQLERVVIKDISVATTETALAHGLKAPPRMFHVMPHSQATVSQSKASDAARIYLIASVACVVDIEVIA